MIMPLKKISKKGKFDFYCKRLGGAGKPGIDGSDVQAYWNLGKHKEIQEYCEAEMKDMVLMYNRLKGYYY